VVRTAAARQREAVVHRHLLVPHQIAAHQIECEERIGAVIGRSVVVARTDEDHAVRGITPGPDQIDTPAVLTWLTADVAATPEAFCVRRPRTRGQARAARHVNDVAHDDRRSADIAGVLPQATLRFAAVSTLIFVSAAL